MRFRWPQLVWTTGVDENDLNAAAQLFGWAQAAWSTGAAIIAFVGHSRAQTVFQEWGYSWAYLMAVLPYTILAIVLVIGRFRYSRNMILYGSLYGAGLCVADLIIVTPLLLHQSAGIEIVNWVFNFICFMLSAVVVSKRKRAPK